MSSAKKREAPAAIDAPRTACAFRPVLPSHHGVENAHRRGSSSSPRRRNDPAIRPNTASAPLPSVLVTEDPYCLSRCALVAWAWILVRPWRACGDLMGQGAKRPTTRSDSIWQHANHIFISWLHTYSFGSSLNAQLLSAETQLLLPCESYADGRSPDGPKRTSS